MKIAHLIFSFNTGGSETMLVDIANEQVKMFEVSIVIINRIYNEILLSNIDKRVKVYFINRTEKSRSPFPIITLNILLWKLEVDVLHCHNHNIIPLLHPLLRKKAVLTLHCMGIPSKYLRKYRHLFAISESVRQDLLLRTKIKSIVIYNGISANNIHTKQDKIPKDIFKILCIGRLDHNIKGQHLIIRALYFLKNKKINNIQLDLIGNGKSQQFLEELIKKYDLEDQVTLLGLRDRDYIYTNLQYYDLLVQPSLFEGFGLSVIEGMAAKIPVLVSDIDGPMEIIEFGKFGFHFQAGNFENLAEQISKIKSIYTTVEFRKKLDYAYNHVQINFDIKNTVKNYMNHYNL